MNACGIVARRSVADAILEICEAVARGEVSPPFNTPRYVNIDRMKLADPEAAVRVS